MKSIDLFYQGEGLGEVAHIELESDVTFAFFKAIVVEKHGLSPDVMIFVEDDDEPIDEAILLKERASSKGLKVHFHRCRHVEVTVTFNQEMVKDRFSPSATVARVKRWAAEKKFGMSDEEAGEHVLQIAGTHDRPTPGLHIGSLIDGKTCGLAFDLVPDERVNGASGSQV